TQRLQLTAQVCLHVLGRALRTTTATEAELRLLTRLRRRIQLAIDERQVLVLETAPEHVDHRTVRGQLGPDTAPHIAEHLDQRVDVAAVRARALQLEQRLHAVVVQHGVERAALRTVDALDHAVRLDTRGNVRTDQVVGRLPHALAQEADGALLLRLRDGRVDRT